jgi:hypothetical protein
MLLVVSLQLLEDEQPTGGGGAAIRRKCADSSGTYSTKF